VKKVGIVCDNYKLDLFKKKLEQKTYEYKTLPFTKDTTSIILYVQTKDVAEINKICNEVELHFKRSN
jgi:hypothetical protein